MKESTKEYLLAGCGYAGVAAKFAVAIMSSSQRAGATQRMYLSWKHAGEHLSQARKAKEKEDSDNK